MNVEISGPSCDAVSVCHALQTVSCPARGPVSKPMILLWYPGPAGFQIGSPQIQSEEQAGQIIDLKMIKPVSQRCFESIQLQFILGENR